MKKCARGSVSRVLSSSLLTMCDHSSKDIVTNILKQSTRATGRRMPYAAPIRFCSRWGLPCRLCYQRRGALLPHRFDLAGPKTRWFNFCGTIPKVTFAGRYPAPFLAGARTFLPYEDTLIPAVARPSGHDQIAGPPSYSKSKLHNIARHAPSIAPSIFSGRNRR
jgi:hypothetical protein